MRCFWTVTSLAAGSAGLSGNTSKNPRPRISSRGVMVARTYASLTATIVYWGALGRRTRYSPGAASNRVWKSGVDGYLFLMKLVIPVALVHGPVHCNLMESTER